MMGENIFDFLPVVHAESGDHQHAGEGGQRDFCHHGSEDKHEGQESQRMEDTGKPCAGAGFQCDAGTSDGRCGGDSSEKRKDDIADPLATSSWSLFSLTFAILPALAPHSRLSIIPSMAILTAGPINPLRFAGVMAAKSNRVSRKSVFGMAPTVWISSFRLTDRMVARIMLKKEAGTTAFHFLGKKTINRTTKSPRPAACILTGKPDVHSLRVLRQRWSPRR